MSLLYVWVQGDEEEGWNSTELDKVRSEMMWVVGSGSGGGGGCGSGGGGGDGGGVVLSENMGDTFLLLADHLDLLATSADLTHSQVSMCLLLYLNLID
ncbi:hypothetical protein E2C01_016253 [Portunus trituberculatus]|uniref:Uncharacterized protein n=1 Tax=Portunus trituberculatus TaxID=210409 RepID=A0A5B7DQG1_PORTR|nr:hypothetical protein [Portunus trituberculatus]